MIIMRALVATVLLITLVLVSIVLINAKSRSVEESLEILGAGDGEIDGDSYAQPDGLETVEEMEEIGSDEVTLDSQELNTDAVDTEDDDGLLLDLLSGENGEGGITIGEAVKLFSHEAGATDDAEELTEEEKEILFTDGFTVDYESQEKFEKDVSDVSRYLTTQRIPLETDSIEEVTDAAQKEDTESTVDIPKDSKFLESRTLKEIKKRAKTKDTNGGRKTSQKPETQPSMVPLGYEPESYLMVDPEAETESTVTSDLDPLTSETSPKVLGRKQRAAYANPETYIVNQEPLTADFDAPSDHDDPSNYHVLYAEPHAAVKPHQYLMDKPSKNRDVQAAFRDGAGMPTVFNPRFWNPHHMNMLRRPQCSSCAQHSVPLCKTCGKCSHCCQHSGCSCGCLRGLA
ncbi:uncharacterized protein LOC129747394 [Uranotaenia lowii]|uniref:uncharacterized protein LOC129747394 n=1 Tax=Uranotaenia lowii TaxID=190385 RepID=UPI00247AF9CE|nr:uncharacterized protein LOC129747394 [Uranotaenia lowii]